MVKSGDWKGWTDIADAHNITPLISCAFRKRVTKDGSLANFTNKNHLLVYGTGIQHSYHWVLTGSYQLRSPMLSTKFTASLQGFFQFKMRNQFMTRAAIYIVCIIVNGIYHRLARIVDYIIKASVFRERLCFLFIFTWFWWFVSKKILGIRQRS